MSIPGETLVQLSLECADVQKNPRQVVPQNTPQQIAPLDQLLLEHEADTGDHHSPDLLEKTVDDRPPPPDLRHGWTWNPLASDWVFQDPGADFEEIHQGQF